MADNHADAVDLADHPGFQRRVLAAMVKTAVAIGVETNDTDQSGFMRRALAQRVVADPDSWIRPFAIALAVNPAITLKSMDGDLDWSIGVVWGAMAGVATAAAPELRAHKSDPVR
ncbi:MAG: hypothetical protein ACT4NY_08995 [Pseudonocardiales bacterium]